MRSSSIRTAIDVYVDASTPEIAIFKIDVKGLNIDFYIDSVSCENDINNAVYTYGVIPNNRIELLFRGTIDEYKNRYQLL